MGRVRSNIIVVSEDSSRLSLMISIIEKHCNCCDIRYCHELWDIYEIIRTGLDNENRQMPMLVLVDMHGSKIREDFYKLENVRASLPELGMVIVPFVEQKKLKKEDWKYISRSKELILPLSSFSQEELRVAIRSVMKMWVEALQGEETLENPSKPSEDQENYSRSLSKSSR